MTEDIEARRAPVRVEVTAPAQYTDEWLDRLPYLPRVSSVTDLGLAAGDRALMVTAHPDDETFAAGATLAALSRLGVHVHVHCLTAGEAALDHVGVEVPDLARRRVAELTESCRLLGVDYSLANLPDGRLSELTDDACESVWSMAERVAPQRILTLWWGDPHPDHSAVGGVARLVAADRGDPVTAFPIWAQHWSDPRPSMLREKFAVITNPARACDQREQAVAVYRTQCEPLRDDLECVLPAWFLRWSTELAVFG